MLRLLESIGLCSVHRSRLDVSIHVTKIELDSSGRSEVLARGSRANSYAKVIYDTDSAGESPRGAGLLILASSALYVGDAQAQRACQQHRGGPFVRIACLYRRSYRSVEDQRLTVTARIAACRT